MVPVPIRTAACLPIRSTTMYASEFLRFTDSLAPPPRPYAADLQTPRRSRTNERFEVFPFGPKSTSASAGDFFARLRRKI